MKPSLFPASLRRLGLASPDSIRQLCLRQGVKFAKPQILNYATLSKQKTKAKVRKAE